MATIQETVTLPSKGLLYGVKFNPKVTLRSMTTEEEMLRLSPTDSEYQTMSSIIESCLKEKLPISVYDLCLGDYEFLLHKLRIVTYGPEYKMVIQCPNCEEVVKSTVNLDYEEVLEFDEDKGLDLEIVLPISKHKIKLSLQTPRKLDIIKEKSKDMRKKTKLNVQYEVMFTAMSLIQEIDGKQPNEMYLEKFVRELPLKDTNYLIQKGDEINRKVGLDNQVVAKCSNCNYEVVTSFRQQPEFFGPQID